MYDIYIFAFLRIVERRKAKTIIAGLDRDNIYSIITLILKEKIEKTDTSTDISNVA